MGNNEKSRWTEIAIEQPVNELIKHGPTLKVRVLNPDTGGSILVAAQFDSGASEVAISMALAKRLGLKPFDSGGVQHAGSDARNIDYFRIKLLLPDLGIPNLDFEVPGLNGIAPPHDVLIGRNFLQHSMMLVNFLTGVTTIHLSHFWR